MASRDHGGGLGVSRPVVRSSRSVGERLRAAALVWPYIGLVGGTLVLSGADQASVAKLWWLAPAAVLAYLVTLLLTVTAIGARQRRSRIHGAELEALADRLRSAIAAPPPHRRILLEPLVSRLRDVRSASAAHLTEAETDAVREALIELGAHDAIAAQVRRARAKRRRADMLFTLGWLGDERSIPVLADALCGRDVDLAYVAGQALTDYASPHACHALVAALQRGGLQRPLVATLLESSRYPGAGELIAAASGDPDARVRGWVAYLIGRGSDPRARAWLAPLAADQDAEVRASAAEAYGACPDPAMLAALMRDDEPRVRAGAAKAAGNAALAALVPNLTALMSDRAWLVRQHAAIALKQLGQAAVGHLRRLLEDDDRFVRNKAAEILIEVGFISEQIAALRGTPDQIAAARHVLAAVARAEARETLKGSAEAADPVTRQRLMALLDEVDGTSEAVRSAA